jgi:hypothetical protein
MKPILIASPRTGSTIIGKQIGDLAEQWWGYKNYLAEYFSVGLVKSSIVEKEGILHVVFQGYDNNKGVWHEDLDERIRRRELLNGKTEYMIKMLPGNFDDWTIPWIKENWNPIFLERRNKLDQLLSYLAFRSTNIGHYRKDSNKVVSEFDYKWEWVDEFFWSLNKFNQIKSQLTGPTIYYEDWLEEGGDQSALIKLLNWSNKQYTPMPEMGKPTPYTNIPEHLIRNKTDWNLDKSIIISRLDGCVY